MEYKLSIGDMEKTKKAFAIDAELKTLHEKVGVFEFIPFYNMKKNKITLSNILLFEGEHCVGGRIIGEYNLKDSYLKLSAPIPEEVLLLFRRYNMIEPPCVGA